MKYLFLLGAVFTFLSCKNTVTEEFKNSTIKGLVISKYRDKMQHNVPMLVYKSNNASKEINVTAWATNSDLWEFVAIGDSIIKYSGSKNITIVKNDIRKEYSF